MRRSSSQEMKRTNKYHHVENIRTHFYFFLSKNENNKNKL